MPKFDSNHPFTILVGLLAGIATIFVAIKDNWFTSGAIEKVDSLKTSQVSTYSGDKNSVKDNATTLNQVSNTGSTSSGTHIQIDTILDSPIKPQHPVVIIKPSVKESIINLNKKRFSGNADDIKFFDKKGDTYKFMAEISIHYDSRDILNGKAYQDGNQVLLESSTGRKGTLEISDDGTMLTGQFDKKTINFELEAR